MELIDITVTREIPAPGENVFDVWIDPKSPGGPLVRRGTGNPYTLWTAFSILQ